MSSAAANPTASTKIPLVLFTWSLNPDSWYLNGGFSRFTSWTATEAWSFVRMVAVMAFAVALERSMAPLAWAGESPMPLLPAVAACYVLTTSYGRMISACVLAGLFRDAFSPATPLGCSSLLFLLAGVVVRELCDNRRQVRVTDEILAGFVLTACVGFLGHVVLVSSGVAGHASFADVLRRVLGGAFVAALFLTPVLRPAKVVAGRCVHWAVRMAGAGMALMLAWFLRHLNLHDRGLDLPDHPVPAQP